MHQNETIEIGIFLLPSDKVACEISLYSEKLVRDLGICYNIHNVPHLSLFQMCVDNQNFPLVIDRVKETVKNVKSSKNLIFKKDLQMKGDNFFLNIEVSQYLLQLNRQIVEAVHTLRSRNFMKQVVDSAKKEHQEYIEQYGIWWGLPHNYDPHFTLFYNLEVPIDETQLDTALFGRVRVDLFSDALRLFFWICIFPVNSKNLRCFR